MSTIFYIDGGAGRVIASIPALLKYHRLNPGKEWYVIIPAWDGLLWSIPELQDRTYGADTKGVWDNIVSKCTDLITPEPYRLPAYFRQEISLVEAFDREINKTTDHKDLGYPKMQFNHAEKVWAQNTLADVKQAQQKLKTIVIQPFGRGATLDRSTVIDNASRSLSPDAYINLVRRLAAEYNMVFFGEPQFQIVTDTYSAKLANNTDLRMWASFIDAADYFIGVDSVGQHMARATDTPGAVFMGSTFEKNVTYPDHFRIIRNKGRTPVYSPIRVGGIDGDFADRLNDGIMTFTKDQLDNFCNIINRDIYDE